MAKVLHSQSTLTDRYQTTIPEPIREVLHLNKRDKIEYLVEDSGKVIIHRVEEEDPIIGKFLAFLTADMEKNPEHIKQINSALFYRAQSLVSGIEVDLEAPLPEKDE